MNLIYEIVDQATPTPSLTRDSKVYIAPSPVAIFVILGRAMARTIEEKLWVLQEKLKETDANLSVCIVLLQQYLRHEQYAAPDKPIAFFALVALAFAYPGGLDGGHGGDYATPIVHGHPVVTKVFENPGLGYFSNYAPKIEGHLVGRGFGPHINGGHGYH